MNLTLPKLRKLIFEEVEKLFLKEKMYFVKAINRRKNRFYWFYEEELIVLSKAEKKDE